MGVGWGQGKDHNSTQVFSPHEKFKNLDSVLPWSYRHKVKIAEYIVYDYTAERTLYSVQIPRCQVVLKLGQTVLDLVLEGGGLGREGGGRCQPCFRGEVVVFGL